jgi:hypothetical protein
MVFSKLSNNPKTFIRLEKRRGITHHTYQSPGERGFGPHFSSSGIPGADVSKAQYRIIIR